MKTLQFSLLILMAFLGRSQDIITTIEETGTVEYNGDNTPAFSTQIGNHITDIDNAENIYLAETSNLRVGKIDASTGFVSTIAATGNLGYKEDDIDAISANALPKERHVDSDGNLIIVDGLGDYRNRKLEPSTPSIFVIPDPSFASFLESTYPAIISNGNELDIAGAATIGGTMNVSNLSISDLSGIAFFTSLSRLLCAQNSITSLDISDLNLTYLSAHSNGMTSITGLVNNANLEELYLEANQLTDVSGIAGLSNLTTCYVHSNQLSSLPSLGGLPNLTDFNIRTNPFPSGWTLDVSANANLIKLQCGFTNLAAIQGLSNTQLEFLECKSNQITDLSDLASLPGMKTIWAASNQLSTFPSLSGFPDLEWIQLTNNPLTIGTLEVSGNPLLEYIQVSGTNLSAITGLSNCQVLYELNAQSNQLTDVSDLQSITTLHSVWLTNNQLTSLPWLGASPGLFNLTFSNNPMSNWTLDVSSNTSLRRIYGANSNLDAVIGLENLSNLTNLFLDQNNLTSLADLTNTDLFELNVQDNKLDFSDARELRIANDLPNISLYKYDNQKDFTAIDHLEGCSGQSLTISIDPQDSATSYQWFKDGIPISGATSSHYTISSFSATDVGSYSCQSFGSALDYPSSMSFAPGVSSFQSEPISVIENTTGCAFIIPDSNFAAFLTTTYPSIMSNGNELDIAGAAAVTGAMNCTNQGIADLTGIEYFTGIRNFVASRNVLTNTNGLEALVDAHTIFLDLNQLTSLPDFSAFPDLKYLRVNNNPLTNTVLDLTGNSEIRELACARSNLTEILGLGNMVHLKHFGCELNDLTNLSGIENATGLISLKCHQNQISSLPGFSIYPDLTYLSIGNNPLPAGILDVSQNPKLRELGCDRNNITEIVGLANLTDLRHFGCQVNQLTHLNGIENATELISLKCLANQITSLPPLSTFPDLLYVNIGQNLLNLGSFDITNNPKMIEFGCSTSGITELVGLEDLYQLRNFDCSRNELTTLAGLDGMTTLIGVGASYNQIEVLPDLSSSPNLILLRVERNKLTFEDIEPNLFVPTFSYHTQADVGVSQTIEVLQGEDLDVTILVGGASNVYQWFKNGVPLTGQTSDQLIINGVSPSDGGVYTLQITNTQATGLILNSEAVTITVIENRPPIANCQNIEIQADTNCSVSLTADQLDGGSTDPDEDELTFSMSPSGPFGIGTHEVTLTVTDPSGASGSCLAEITVTAEPLELVLETELFGDHPISCAGAADGAIWSTVTGGCLPYSYDWSNGSTSADISGLDADTYTLTVIDGNGLEVTSEFILTEPEELEVSIADPSISDLEVCAFAEANLVVGYGTGYTSITLSASAVGGNTSNYSYKWLPATNLDDPNSSTPTFIPDLDQTGCSTYTFEVTAMDEQGCESSEMVSVDVVNVGVMAGKGKNASHKVQICHKGKSTIEVSENAVVAHLAHGDCLGTCDVSCGGSESRIASSEQLGSLNKRNDLAITAEVFPNPSKGKFRVLMNLKEGIVEMQLFNLSGRMVDQKSVKASPNMQIEMGGIDLTTGLYMLKIINGESSTTRKVSIVK